MSAEWSSQKKVKPLYFFFLAMIVCAIASAVTTIQSISYLTMVFEENQMSYMLNETQVAVYQCGIAIAQLVIVVLITLIAWHLPNLDSAFSPSHKWISLLAGVLSILRGISSFVFPYLMNTRFFFRNPPGNPINPEFNFADIAFGLFLICLSVVFSYGSNLKEDSDSII